MMSEFMKDEAIWTETEEEPRPPGPASSYRGHFWGDGSTVKATTEAQHPSFVLMQQSVGPHCKPELWKGLGDCSRKDIFGGLSWHCMRSWGLDPLWKSYVNHTWSVSWIKVSKYYLINVSVFNIKIDIIFLAWWSNSYIALLGEWYVIISKWATSVLISWFSECCFQVF